MFSIRSFRFLRLDPEQGDVKRRRISGPSLGVIAINV
jgi:hypothetical protein